MQRVSLVTLRTVYATTIPATPRPPYQPTRRGSLVAVDTVESGHDIQVAFSMELSQTLHLVAPPPAVEWLVIYDPMHWQNSSSDAPPATGPEDFYTAVPADGWLLAPRITGTLPITLHVRLNPCPACINTSTIVVYTIDVHE